LLELIKKDWQNLDFDRKGEVVEKEHISKPVLIGQTENWKLFHLPTHRKHFYDVHRYEFVGEIEIQTNNQCHVMMLVEGVSLILTTANGLKQRFNYAETFVVPAACRSYTLMNESDKPCKLVKAFVK